MHNWLFAALTCLVLNVPVDVHAAQVPPIPDNPIRAQTALGFNPKTRCPDLRITDEGTMAVVVFWLPSTGIPSRIAIKSSSGSNALDSAAIDCVSRLRFAAATTLGDGNSIDSWQQIAWTWANHAAAPAPTTANAIQGDSGGAAKSVTVHVCIDEAGKLVRDPAIVRSSGMASLDQAAVRIAASGSAYYRPDTSPNGPPVSGCVQLAIRFDMK
jgi:TonB family protein